MSFGRNRLNAEIVAAERQQASHAVIYGGDSAPVYLGRSVPRVH